MAKASRYYTSKHNCSQTPTLDKNSYMFMIRTIRKEMEKRNNGKVNFRNQADILQPGNCDGNVQ